MHPPHPDFPFDTPPSTEQDLQRRTDLEELVGRLDADIALVDITMPGMNGAKLAIRHGLTGLD